MSSPEESLDPDIQNKLFEEGATFVFLDVPSGTEFGIDMSVFYVGEKFRGVKMIPPGLHFIYYSAVSKHGQSAARTGFFHKFRPKGILVKKWNKLQEAISDEVIDKEEIERYKDNLQDLDRYLGPYPYKMWRTWVSLTSYITEPLLHQLEPELVIVSSATRLTPLTYTSGKNYKAMDVDQSTSYSDSVENLLPEMKPLPGTEIRFTDIPSRRYPEGASPAEITKHGMDSTYNLEQVLSNYEDPFHILGELQMAFVCFLVGHVFEAFEQWQKLVRLLCTCDTALEKYPELYLKFIVTVYFQLKEVPKDYFVDIVSSYNFLTSTFQIFFSNLANSKADETLCRRGLHFKENLTKMFKWDFDSEPDDCAPTIVEEAV